MGVDSVLDKDSVLRVEGRPVLVGGGRDGASVNVGDHTGLKAQMQQCLPWLYWSWCYAHRLELACKNAFSSSLSTNIVEMLLRLFYIYEKSPKKSHELTNIVDNLQGVFEFPRGGHLPVRLHGTRWITQEKSSSACLGPLWCLHTPSNSSYRGKITQARGQRLKGYLFN